MELPIGWGILFVIGFVSPAAGFVAAGLQWLLRKRIPNVWVRVGGSLLVGGTLCGAGFVWLIAYFSW